MLTLPPKGPIPDGPLLIGDVAELTGLSLRSIRHYEELGLAVSESRTAGGFRVFGAEAVERLRLVMMLRVMGLSLEEIGPIVEVCRAAELGSDEAAHSELLVHAQESVEVAQVELEARVKLAAELGERLRVAAQLAESATGLADLVV